MCWSVCAGEERNERGGVVIVEIRSFTMARQALAHSRHPKLAA